MRTIWPKKNNINNPTNFDHFENLLYPRPSQSKYPTHETQKCISILLQKVKKPHDKCVKQVQNDIPNLIQQQV